MEFWPADFKTDVAPFAKKRRKGKEGHAPNNQSIEPGTLGAATLISGRKSLQWTTLVQPSSRNLPRVVGKPLEVFPPTMPPSVNVPTLSVHQRAEQGVSDHQGIGIHSASAFGYFRPVFCGCTIQMLNYHSSSSRTHCNRMKKLWIPHGTHTLGTGSPTYPWNQ